jgi:Ca2+-binding RTX toxin-like protein
MKSPRTLSLLGLSLLVILALAATADAKPQVCWIECTASSACSTSCTDDLGIVITCGQWGVCDTGGCSCQSYIYGTSGGDTLSGDAYNNCIYGFGGDDTISGNSGGDKLYGDAGNDTLYGNSGNDCLYGGSGWDHLDGGTGTDYCVQGEAYVSCP